MAPKELDVGTPVGRRIVLGMVGLGAVGVVAGRWLSQGVSEVVASTAPGLASVIPAAGGFRIYTVTSGYPETDLASYRLSVTGRVGKQLSLSMADLAALPQTSMTKDFQCVTGWRVQDVPWSGVLVSDVLLLGCHRLIGTHNPRTSQPSLRGRSVIGPARALASASSAHVDGTSP